MIRNEQEYAEAVARLKDEVARLAEHRRKLMEQGFTGESLERLLDPFTSFHLQFQEDVESYERLRRGEVRELTNLRTLGNSLVCLRIARGSTQQE